MGLPMESVLVATAEHPLDQSTDRDDSMSTAPAAYALAVAQALRAAGGRAAIVAPAVNARGGAVPTPAVRFGLGPENCPCTITLSRAEDGLSVYAASIDDAFPRDGVYGPRRGEPYADNARRFALFSRAIVEVAQRLSPPPEHLLLCDWPCALAAALVQSNRLPFKPIVQVFDPRFQGLIEAAEFGMLGLPQEFFRRETGEFFGKFSFLKAGLSHAAKVCALSARHAQMLCRSAAGLEGVFKLRRHLLAGLPTAVSLVAAGVPASISKDGYLHVYTQDPDAMRVSEVFGALDMLSEMGMSHVYHGPTSGSTNVAVQTAVETAIRAQKGKFRRATPCEGCGEMALFLDGESADPLPVLRAWLAGAVVCAPATAALQDAKHWLDRHGFDVKRLLLFRNSERLGLFDIVQEASRMRNAALPKVRDVLDAAMLTAGEELRVL